MKKNRVRSDIPYVERLKMNKLQTIAAHRDDAAQTALKVSCVALNDVFGFGYSRSVKFADRVRELLTEYYKDPDLEEEHLNERLRQIGFTVEAGHVYKQEETK